MQGNYYKFYFFRDAYPQKYFWNVYENYQENIRATIYVNVEDFKFCLQRRLVPSFDFLFVNLFVRLAWEFWLIDISLPLLFWTHVISSWNNYLAVSVADADETLCFRKSWRLNTQ